MANFRLTHLANQDLNDIWKYTFQTWSVQQADKYYYQLIESFNRITANPECGKNYDGVEPKLRGLKTGKPIVFYEMVDKNTIEIIRILHEQMDLKSRFSE